MKQSLKKIMSLLLAGLMLTSSVACSVSDDTSGETKDISSTEMSTEEETGYRPDIQTKNYGESIIMTGIIETGIPAVVEKTTGDALEKAEVSFLRSEA